MVGRFFVGTGGPLGPGAMLPEEIVVKEGRMWTLKARYDGGRLLFYLVDAKEDFPHGNLADMALEPYDWDRLVKWVEWQRAEQEVRRRTGRYLG